MGEDNSSERVSQAVKQALTHPLLDVDYTGATGALIHITCGPDLKLEEFDHIGRIVSDNLSPEANVIIGARISKEFAGRVRVITIMTGVKSPYLLGKSAEESLEPISKELSDVGIEVWR
jgi:cell division protein FtsZ